MKNIRRFIHIHGQQKWCIDITNELFFENKNTSSKIIYCGIDSKHFGDEQSIYIDNTKKRSEIEHHLGSEYSALIFNCFNGFNPALFCSLAGLIKAPGVIILITPDINHWPDYPDPDYFKFCSYPYTPKNVKGRYIRYFIRQLAEQSESEYFFTLAQNSLSKEKLSSVKTIIYSIFNEITLDHGRKIKPNLKQKTIIASIERLAAAKANGIITIYGDRGRGKSSTIGMALQSLAASTNKFRISVVSQNKRNVAPVFTQLIEPRYNAPDNNSVNFYPPDEFLRNKPACDLLIIDEAAAISLTVLKQLIDSTHKVIIASTIDGYEGTGMGLRVKLQAYFASINRSLNSFELTTPLRWETNDAVEQFIFKTCLAQKNTLAMNDDAAPRSESSPAQIVIEKVDRDKLVNDTQKIYQFFHLLTDAHYRTTPDDLRYLLDAPAIELWIAGNNGTSCGILIVSDEGGIDDIFDDDIWLGKRRLNGHLIPQTLSSQSGFKQAPGFSYKRIIRIAVEEKYRRQGIASQLLSGYYNSLTEQHKNLDFIGVSYGYEPGLYRFWQALSFNPIRISHRENARSGLKSMLMLKPISMRSRGFCQQLENNFKQDLLFNLNHSQNHVFDFDMISVTDFQITQKDHRKNQLDIYAFAFGNRQYLNCERPLYEFSVYCLNTKLLSKSISQEQIDLIALIVLQKTNWAQAAKLLGLDGKKQILTQLRAAYAILYNCVWGNKS